MTLWQGWQWRASTRVGPDGRFHFDVLPASYALALEMPAGVAAPPLVEVAVQATERAIVTLSRPEHTVAIEIRGDCSYVDLEPRARRYLAAPTLGYADCHDDHAELTGVSPGLYRVCLHGAQPWDCEDIEVTASPDRQVFEL